MGASGWLKTMSPLGTVEHSLSHTEQGVGSESGIESRKVHSHDFFLLAKISINWSSPGFVLL